MASAIIVAGGQGTRMAADVPKQYLLLGQIPVWLYTLTVFTKCQSVEKIVLVTPENDADSCRSQIVAAFGGSKDIIVVAGGKRRQDSVYNGLLALEKQGVSPDSNQVVAVHDGVRPFVTVEQIEDCIDTAHRHGVAILAIPAFDTLKKVNAESEIEATIDRGNIWMAQTPQAFHYHLLKKAHDHARQNRIKGTDDAGLVERLGYKIKIVPGSRLNLKVTTPEDYKWAQRMASQ